MTFAAFYNALTTLEEADKLFVDRDRIFAAVTSPLARYGNAFGICLVHARCTLTDDEIVLTQGNISKPVKTSSLTEYYPVRWLPSGEAYEFTTRRTTLPLVALVHLFNQLTSHIGVLGLYHKYGGRNSKMIEHMDGRASILEPLRNTPRASTDGHIETAWNLDRGDPSTMTCAIAYDFQKIQSGFNNAQKYVQMNLLNLLAYQCVDPDQIRCRTN